MAHWQMGDKDEARKLYGQVIQWIDKNPPEDKKLARARREAETLLQIHDTKESTPKIDEDTKKNATDTKAAIQ